MAFLKVNNFFVRFQKYQPKEHLFLKLNQRQNMKKNIYGGFSSKTKKNNILGVQIGTF